MPGIHGEVPLWNAHHQPLRNRWAVPKSYTQVGYPPGPIPVRVRLHWYLDGEEWRDGHATAWTTRLVLVQVADQRLGANAIWVEAHDVKRR